MRKFLALLLILAASFFLFSSENAFLRGLVTDEFNNPLPGVKIVLKGENLSFVAHTGETGFFFFKNIPPGKYSLSFALKGFQSKFIKEIKIPLGKVPFIKIALIMGKKGKVEEKRRILPDRISFSQAISFNEEILYLPLPQTISQLAQLLATSQKSGENLYWEGMDFGKELFYTLKFDPSLDSASSLSVRRADFSGKEERLATIIQHETSPQQSFLSANFYYAINQKGENKENLVSLHNFLLSGGILKENWNFFFSWQKEERRTLPYAFDEKVETKKNFIYGKLQIGKLLFKAFSSNKQENFSHQYTSFLHSPAHTPSSSGENWGMDLSFRMETPILSSQLSTGIYTWKWEFSPRAPRGSYNSLTGAYDPFLSRKDLHRKYFISGDLLLLQSYLFGADHILKAGFNLDYFSFNRIYSSPNPRLDFMADATGAFLPGFDPALRYTRIYQVPQEGQESGGHALHISFFLQDNWGLGKLNAFVGLRYDYYRSYYDAFYRRSVPEGLFLDDILFENYSLDLFKARVIPSRRGMNHGNIGIRVGLSYPLGNYILFKAGLARFIEPMLFTKFAKLFPMGLSWAEFFWKDFNGDGEPQGEEILQLGFYHPPFPEIDVATPYTDVIFLSLQASLPLDVEGEAFLSYETSKNRLAIVNSSYSYSPDQDYWIRHEINEPGPDGIFGTADDSLLEYYIFDFDNQEYKYVLTVKNPSELDQSLLQFGLNLQRPFYNGFSFFFNSSYSIFRGIEGELPLLTSPNQLVNARAKYTKVKLRLGFVTSLPLNSYLGMYYYYSSGRPYYRKLLLITEEPWPFNMIELYANAKGYDRAKAVNCLNLSLTKNFSFQHLRGQLFLHVFNLLNSNFSYEYRDFQGYLTTDGRFYPLQTWKEIFRKWGGRSIRFGIRLNLF